MNTGKIRVRFAMTCYGLFPFSFMFCIHYDRRRMTYDYEHAHEVRMMQDRESTLAMALAHGLLECIFFLYTLPSYSAHAYGY